MKSSKLIKEAMCVAEPHCVTNGEKFRLKDCHTADTSGVKNKKQAEKLLQESSAVVSQMQELLFAQDRWALLLIFQGMDAAGKDGAIKHVMSGVNPQGCDVHAFKQPTHEELDHDFLWRCQKVLPERGKIGIFNRSYCEEVLVVRIHPQLLDAQRLPKSLVTKHIWEERFKDINHFERYITHNGVVIRKFFLHVSKEEQRRRLLSRLDDPEKNWKLQLSDVQERGYWRDYMEAYEEAIQNTAEKYAPWYVVPADNKWYARLVVASAIVEALHKLDLQYPEADKSKKKELDEIRTHLEKNDK
jgi:PPK2 family polyphosphate:nucleotide phosphotransferase